MLLAPDTQYNSFKPYRPVFFTFIVDFKPPRPHFMYWPILFCLVTFLLLASKRRMKGGQYIQKGLLCLYQHMRSFNEARGRKMMEIDGRKLTKMKFTQTRFDLKK